MPITESELSQLMQDNLATVWSERDESLRLKAIEAIYAADSTLYEVGEAITGYEAINAAIGKVVGGLPPIFVLSRLKPIIINNNAGRLVWGLGPEGAPPVATGMDVAIFENGKIKSLYVFLDGQQETDNK